MVVGKPDRVPHTKHEKRPQVVTKEGVIHLSNLTSPSQQLSWWESAKEMDLTDLTQAGLAWRWGGGKQV